MVGFSPKLAKCINTNDAPHGINQHTEYQWRVAFFLTTPGMVIIYRWGVMSLFR